MFYQIHRNLTGMTLAARDGEIGRIKDVYFDDAEWVCRYLVVDTGGWLSGRRVLITPHALRRIDFEHSTVNVDLTQDQVRRSPLIECDMPISRQQETSYYNYYALPYYWAGPYLWGPTPAIAGPIHTTDWDAAMEAQLQQRARERERYDPHLRSANEVRGYRIQASDGLIGEVDDLILNEHDWQVGYFVVDTRKWLPGKHVLVAVDWVQSVSWSESAVRVDLSKEAVRTSPQYHSDTPLASEEEASLYAHYGRERPQSHGARPIA